jgi:hypothetical protein
LAAFHFEALQHVGFGELLRRMVAFKAPLLSGPALIFLWMAYLAATLTILYIAVRQALAPTTAKQRRGFQSEPRL